MCVLDTWDVAQEGTEYKHKTQSKQEDLGRGAVQVQINKYGDRLKKRGMEY